MPGAFKRSPGSKCCPPCSTAVYVQCIGFPQCSSGCPSTVSVTGPQNFTVSMGGGCAGSFVPTIAGSYTGTATITLMDGTTCTKYGSVTVALDCSTYSLTIDFSSCPKPTLPPPGTVNLSGCGCGPCDNIPTTLHATVTGPAYLLGAQAGVSLALTYQGMVDNGNTVQWTWGTGCKPQTGAYWECVNLVVPYCSIYNHAEPGPHQSFGSYQATFTIVGPSTGSGTTSGHCYSSFRFQNYWSGSCTNSPQPVCTDTQKLAQPEACSVPGTCPDGSAFTSYLFFSNASYGQSTVVHGTSGSVDSACSSTSDDGKCYKFCTPVNWSGSYVMDDMTRFGGTCTKYTFGVTITS